MVLVSIILKIDHRIQKIDLVEPEIKTLLCHVFYIVKSLIVIEKNYEEKFTVFIDVCLLNELVHIL